MLSSYGLKRGLTESKRLATAPRRLGVRLRPFTMANETTKQDGMIDANADAAAIRRGRPRKRNWLIVLSIGALVIAAAVVWRFLLPSRADEMPLSLSERDKKEIAGLLRGWTVRHAVRALFKGEFRLCVRSLKISRQQRINRFIDGRDGTFRVYTVVASVVSLK